MTADAKVGLLLGLVFIVIIAFLINGLPKVLEGGTMETLNSPVIQGPDDDSLVLPSEVQRVLEPALPPIQQEVARRQTEPPATERVIIDIDPPSTHEQATADSSQPHESPTASAQRIPKTYTVRSGQNLSSIAKEIFGEVIGNKWATVERFCEHNRDRMDSIDDVKAGQVLAVPSIDEVFTPAAPEVAAPASNPAPGLFERLLGATRNATQETPAKTPQRTYRVQQDDSLWRIAETHLGNGNRYHEILQLNKDIQNPHHLPAGKEIRLPAQ